MPFLAHNNANFQFCAEKFIWKTYITAKALPITSWVELIDKKEFAKTVLDKNSEIFVVHIVILEVKIIHSS